MEPLAWAAEGAALLAKAVVAVTNAPFTEQDASEEPCSAVRKKVYVPGRVTAMKP